MRYETPPIEYKNEAELALKLHLVTLRQDYEHIIKSAYPRKNRKNGNYYSGITESALEKVKMKMIEAEKWLEFILKCEEPIYNLENEAKGTN